MRIRIAGAGAGKTTKMAELLAQSVIPKGMIIYCLAFTHAAVENINKKIKERLGDIPDYIRISTICRQPSETVIKDTIPGQGKT